MVSTRETEGETGDIELDSTVQYTPSAGKVHRNFGGEGPSKILGKETKILFSCHDILGAIQ